MVLKAHNLPYIYAFWLYSAPQDHQTPWLAKSVVSNFQHSPRIVSLKFHVRTVITKIRDCSQSIWKIKKSQNFHVQCTCNNLKVFFILLIVVWLNLSKLCLYLLLEPLHWLLLCYKVLEAHSALLPFSLGNVESRTPQHDVEIHTINPNAGVIFDSKINVFLDSKTKVACAREVILWQLVFTNL